MAQRTFNWKLAIVIVLMFLVLGVTVFALRSYQKNAQITEAYRLGNKAYDEGQWEDAAVSLGRYIARNQSDTEALLKYADAQLKIRPPRQGARQQAISSYRSILRLESSNSVAVERIADIYLAFRQSSTAGEAERILQRFVDDNESVPSDVLYRLALAKFQQQKTEEAVEGLLDIIATEPNYIPAYALMGELAQAFPDDVNDSPDYWFGQAIAQNQDSKEARLARVLYYLRNKEYEKQEVNTDLQWLDSQDSNDVGVLVQLADFRLQLKQLDIAEEKLQKAMLLDSKDRRIWNTWADLAQQLPSDEEKKRKDKMVWVAKEALKVLEPTPKYDFTLTAVNLYIQAEEFKLAQQELDKMLNQETQPPGAIALNARLLFRQEQYREAVNEFRRALELGDGWLEDEQLLQIRQSLSRCLELAGDAAASLIELEQIVIRYPLVVSARLTLAQAYERRGLWEKAREQAQEAVLLLNQQEDLSDDLIALRNSAKYHELKSRINMLSGAGNVENRVWEDIKIAIQELEAALGDRGKEIIHDLKMQVAGARNDVSALEALLAVEPEEGTEAHAKWLLQKATLENASQNFDDSEKLLKRGMELYAQMPDFALRLSALYAYQGDELEDANEVLVAALDSMESDRSKRGLVLSLVNLYLQMDEQDDAISLLKSWMKKLPDDIAVRRRYLDLTVEAVGAADLAKKEAVIEEIKKIEGDTGAQWRYEQARLWAQGETLREKYNEITTLLKEGLQSNPNDQRSMELLAGVQAAYGDLELAAVSFREALAQSPMNLNLIGRTVMVLWQTNQLREAREIVENAMDTVTQRLVTLEEDLEEEQKDTVQINRLNEGLKTLQQLHVECMGRDGLVNEGSVNSLVSLVDDDPNNLQLSLFLTRIRIGQKNFDEAQKLIGQIADEDAESLPVLEMKTELCLARGQSKEARLLLDQIVDVNNSSQVYRFRAAKLKAMGDFDDAEDDYNEALKLDPNNVDIYREMRLLFETAGRLDDAEVQQKKIYNVDKTNTAEAISWAELCMRLEYYQKAVSVLQNHSLATDDKLRTLYEELLAKALYLSAQKAKGEAKFETLIVQNPNDSRAMSLFLETVIQAGDWDKIEVMLPRWFEKRPSSKEMLQIGNLLFVTSAQNASNIDTALDCYQRIADRVEYGTQEHGVAVNNLAWILSQEKGEHQRAYDLSKAALNHYDKYLDLRDTHGSICLALKTYDEAAEVLRDCIEGFEVNGVRVEGFKEDRPSAIGARVRLGEAYIGLGDTSKAEAVLKEAQELQAKHEQGAQADLDKMNELTSQL